VFRSSYDTIRRDVVQAVLTRRLKVLFLWGVCVCVCVCVGGGCVSVCGHIGVP
jgi:hypothetical protein